MEHLDVVVTDWLAGQETRVATFTLLPGGPVKCSVRFEEYSYLDGIEPAGPDGAPVSPYELDLYAEALRHELSSSYMVVTSPHDDRSCLFANADIVPIRSIASA